VVYVFIYPFPDRWAFQWTKKRQHYLREWQKVLDSSAVLTVAESRELRLQVKKTIDETQALLSENKQRAEDALHELREVRALLDQKTQEMFQLQQTNGHIALSDVSVAILRSLQSEPVTIQDLRSRFGLIRPVVLDNLLNELSGSGFIRAFSTNNPTAPEQVFAINEKGLRALTFNGEDTGVEKSSQSS
jgi:DNA-binding HxlR family transcriptional regulator